MYSDWWSHEEGEGQYQVDPSTYLSQHMKSVAIINDYGSKAKL